MKFGTKVWLERGGSKNLRKVVATYIGALGCNVICRLEQDDKGDTVGWNKKGMIGWWSKSAITKVID